MSHAPIPAEETDLFCKSVYTFGFVDCRSPIVPLACSNSDDINQEQERVCNSVQQYFGDLYEDAEQVSCSYVI